MGTKKTTEPKSKQHCTKQFEKELALDYIISIIEMHQCRTIEELVLNVPYSKTTFYEYYPPDSNELNDIKDAINKVKTEKKQAMRNMWEISSVPALSIAAFRLMATPEELEALSMTKNVVTMKEDEKPALPDWMQNTKA